MAVYNEIGIGRWNRFIQKLTDIKGGPPARQLSSEIQVVHGLFHGAENRYLESWDRFGIKFSIGVATQRSAVRFRNPLGSNVVAVIEKINVSVSSLNTVDLQSVATSIDNDTTATGNRLDLRNRPSSIIVVSTNAGGSAPVDLNANGSTGLLAANNPYDFLISHNQELAVLPGYCYQLIGSTVNITITGSFLWRERFLEPAERI